MAIDVYLKLDDVGLFKKPRKHERLSQYQRACEVRDAFAHCMSNALRHHYCVMPELCAQGHAYLDCAHLTVDYANFTGHGIPLTGQARKIIDARLRAIGTLVYRKQEMFSMGPLPGDIHLPALQRISSFQGKRSSAGSAKRVSVRSGAVAKKARRSGLLGWMFG